MEERGERMELQQTEESTKVRVSVVIPIRNEERYIQKCLDSVLEQDFPHDQWEINLVDGDSEDRTVELIQPYLDRYPFIHLYRNPHKTVQYALNIGIREAAGEIIVRLDAHAEYDRSYVSQCVKTLEETGADNVGGPTVVRGKTPMQKVIAAAYHSPFALGGGKCHDADFEGYADTVSFGAYKKETITRIGMYDERFPRSEDDEMNFRLTESGGKIYITPSIKSVYYPRDNLGALFRQYFQYGVWKVAVIRKHKRPARLSHLVPLCFVLFLLVCIPLACFFRPFLWLLLGVLGLYVLLDIYFSFTNRYLTSFVPRLKLCVVHLVLHLSYGLGFLKGIFQFARAKFD